MIKFHLFLGAVAASIATLVAVVLIHDPSPAPADPFHGLHLSAPIPVAIEDEHLAAPVVSYQSDTFGYTVKFPGNWMLDDSRSEFEGDILSDPSERVVITISETADATLMTPEGMDRMAHSIQDALEIDPAFMLVEFERLAWKERPTIFSDGVRLIGGKRFHTRAYTIFRKNHNNILTVSVTTQENAETLYEKPIEDILDSLDVCPKGRDAHQ